MAVIPMLTTATIEIATMRLDKRQVTQAVFRQVHERSPIAADGGLVDGAVPWGTVNYWWAGAENRHGDAIHLLWQLGNRLFRARLSLVVTDRMHVEDYDPDDLEVAWWSRVLSGEIAAKWWHRGYRADVATFELFGEQVEASLDRYDPLEQADPKIRDEEFKKWVDDNLATSLAELKATHARRVAQRAAIETYRTNTFPMLAGLEQLYIAA